MSIQQTRNAERLEASRKRAESIGFEVRIGDTYYLDEIGGPGHSYGPFRTVGQLDDGIEECACEADSIREEAMRTRSEGHNDDR